MCSTLVTRVAVYGLHDMDLYTRGDYSELQLSIYFVCDGAEHHSDHRCLIKKESPAKRLTSTSFSCSTTVIRWYTGLSVLLCQSLSLSLTLSSESSLSSLSRTSLSSLSLHSLSSLYHFSPLSPLSLYPLSLSSLSSLSLLYLLSPYLYLLPLSSVFHLSFSLSLSVSHCIFILGLCLSSSLFHCLFVCLPGCLPACLSFTIAKLLERTEIAFLCSLLYFPHRPPNSLLFYLSYWPFF